MGRKVMSDQEWWIHKNIKLQVNFCIYSKSNLKNLFTKELTCIASVKCSRVVLK